MAAGTDQFGSLSKASVDTALEFARISMQSAERMMHLQLEAARVFIEENSKAAGTLAGSGNPQQAAALSEQLARTSMERAVGYSRNVYEIARQAQTDIAKLMGERATSIGKDVTAAIEASLKSAPGGGDAALAAFQQSVAMTNSAMDALTKAAKQMTDLTAAHFKAAPAAAPKAGKK
jgi:phasin family protein